MDSYTPKLSVQWHITTDCGNRCKHCYMYDDATFHEERENTLSYKGLLQVLDTLLDFETKRGCSIPSFSLTGGDPLLREDWPALVQEITKRGKKVSMMGNPETLNEKTAKQLKDLGVQSFQMSLDGLEATHDDFRSQGSFQLVIEALELLKTYGISSHIMFTLFPGNEDQLLPLMEYLSQEGQPDVFAFDLGCAVGEGAGLANTFSPWDQKEIFRAYRIKKKQLNQEGCKTIFGEKPTLMRLLHFEDGAFYPAPSPFPIIEGCLIGWSSIAILSDGSLMACRRMPLKVGKMPEQSFEEIFLGSELLRKFRRRESYKLCGDCDFYSYCRGCPAYSFGMNKDPFDSSPLCFRKSLAPADTKLSSYECPPMNCSNDEEYRFFRSKFFIDIPYIKEKIMKDSHLQYAIMRFNSNPQEIDLFLRHPKEYLQKNGFTLDAYSLIFLKMHFEGIKGHGRSSDGLPTKEERETFSRLVAPYFLRNLFQHAR